MLVVDTATRLSDDAEVRFAALCHDLGKGATPADILPSHHGHEERGVELLEAVCARFKVPTNAFANWRASRPVTMGQGA